MSVRITGGINHAVSSGFIQGLQNIGSPCFVVQSLERVKFIVPNSHPLKILDFLRQFSKLLKFYLGLEQLLRLKACY